MSWNIRLVFMHQRRNVWAGRRVAGFSVCQASRSACWQCSMVWPRPASQVVIMVGYQVLAYDRIGWLLSH
ncbi:hypothetical protein [Streptomyces sp. NPDC057199]|uniref:hypothetical protein n=1 Tax=Streptomyces sp. NPDC057199 TaxID=3346047 RepID=UPI0036277FAA